MNGPRRLSNCSFHHENTWFGGRVISSSSRAEIENDLFRGNSSPNFLSACSSYLQLRLQEKLGDDSLLENDEPQFQTNSIQLSNFGTSCSVLQFANSCIQLQNIDDYSDCIEKEISNSAIALHMDQILPMPVRESKSKCIYTFLLKNIKNQFGKLKSIFNGKQTTVIPKKSHPEIKKIKLTTKSTQTELSSKKIKHEKKPVPVMLKGRSLKMSIPEEIKEYHSWKAKSSNEMRMKHRIYKMPMGKSNSCMEVVETKVQTKKVTKMRRQSSKLSVCNEDRESDDDFEAYWSQIKLKNSSKF